MCGRVHVEHSGTQSYPLQLFFPNHNQISRRRNFHFKSTQTLQGRQHLPSAFFEDSNFLYWRVFCVPLLLTGFPSTRIFKPIPHVSSSLWEFWICLVWVWPLPWDSISMPCYLPGRRAPFSWVFQDLFLALILKCYSPSVYFHRLWVLKSLWCAVEWQWSVL